MRLLQVGDLADVGIDADGLVAQCDDLLFERFGGVGVRDVVDDDVGTLLGERERDRLADAAVASGDDGDLSFEVHVVAPGVAVERGRTGGAGRGWSAAGVSRVRATMNARTPMTAASAAATPNRSERSTPADWRGPAPNAAMP